MIKLYLLETNVHKIDVIRFMKYFCFITSKHFDRITFRCAC